MLSVAVWPKTEGAALYQRFCGSCLGSVDSDDFFFLISKNVIYTNGYSMHKKT